MAPHLPTDDIKPDLSVIIPFRNRELRRLEVAIRTAAESAGSLATEIIVSDFGSTDIESIRSLCERTGARLVHTSSPRWSRSSCLNRGIEAARGQLIQCDDADMIWYPGALERHATAMLADPSYILNYQVWDLPEHWTSLVLEENCFDWDRMLADAEIHSRWGHGLLLMPRNAYRRVGGYDERMHTYGVEDLDLTKRLRAAGYPQVWAGTSEDYLFHIFHPKTSVQAKTDPKVKKIVDRNRSYYRNDPSVVRNILTGGAGASAPLVSVVISTHNRAQYLRESIFSALYQTVQDLEVVVVDDGSTDHTREIVESIGDARVRYFYQEQAGISAARNRGARESRGHYTAVLDDDDLMLPDRLEIQLAAIGSGVHGCVGNFVNFDDATGELATWSDAEPSLTGAYPKGGFAGHPTWVIETKILRRLGYDESFTSSVDNNIALRALRAGVQFTHCDRIVTLRRRHAGQVTETDGSFQKLGSLLTRSWFRTGVSPTRKEEIVKRAQASKSNTVKTDLENPQLLAYLPDHLVDRTVTVSTISSRNALALLSDSRVSSAVAVYGDHDELLSASGTFRRATWTDLTQFRRDGFEIKLETAARRSSPAAETDFVRSGGVDSTEITGDITAAVQRIREAICAELPLDALLVELPADADADTTMSFRRTLATPSGRTALAYTPFTDPLVALSYLASTTRVGVLLNRSGPLDTATLLTLVNQLSPAAKGNQ